ncbi:MAG: 6-carboxytetrahydropterin synthase [Bacteroidia bacterium]|nr:6-carboxytetrahydropterin synthase [Bacteroidia bacterium]
MIIRKKFRFEGAHIVRNCTSQRCRENIHGHSYEVEVFLKSDQLDNGFMVMDFVRLNNVAEFIHSFDHSYTLWDKETEDVKEAIYRINTRVAEIPVSPSAEGYALLFFFVIDLIIANISLVNGEGIVKLHAVRVHETLSGYAEASAEDMSLVRFTLADIRFNEGIKKEWKDKTWWIKVNNP